MSELSVNKILEKLYSFRQFDIKLGLDNIKKFDDHLANPHKSLKLFHIAGSNGKGSTASFAASILMEAGFKTGLYTSPHFVKFNERIKINSKDISDDYVAEFFNEHEKYIYEKKLTFFEITTAMAFKYFCDQKVDYAVIETGLGGRLDATNIISPLAAVITSISLEHTQYLGNTIQKIAAEKAEIIKRKSHVFVGNIPETAMEVIEQKCDSLKCSLFKVTDYTIEKDDYLELYSEELAFDDWRTPLKGAYQRYNAALAALAVSKVLDTDDFNIVSAGIKNVIVNSGIQGRYEIYNEKPMVILDSAHNTEGVINFLSEFKKEMKKYDRRILLYTAMNDKAVKEILNKLKDYFDEIRLTEINNERSCKVDELMNAAGELGIKGIAQKDYISFVDEFESAGGNNCLVVLGSMYLLGAIKSAAGIKNT